MAADQLIRTGRFFLLSLAGRTAVAGEYDQPSLE